MIAKTLYSWTMQTALTALASWDRRFGNPIVDLEGAASPFEVTEKLRSRGSVLRSYVINGWCVLGHEDVKTLLLDKRLSSSVFENTLIQRAVRASAQAPMVPLIDKPSMLHMDAPNHTRLRKLASRSFTNRFVQSLTPKIELIIDDLLTRIDGTSFDFMERVAKPLPAIVIAEMLGVPGHERHLFEAWSADLVGYPEIFQPDTVRKAVHADLAMRGYLEALVADKRAHPGQDLISAMIAAEEQGDSLDIDELISMCTLLLVAGHETTTRLLGNCLVQLLRHPDQLASATGNSDRMAMAIEESLRLDPPVLAVSRLVQASFDYRGARFRKGQMLLLSIAGANRDPEVHEHPDQFCIDRAHFDHVSFGHGIHLCIGMPLARLEARLALTQLFERFPALQLSTEATQWDESPFFRGPRALQVDTISQGNQPPELLRAS